MTGVAAESSSADELRGKLADYLVGEGLVTSDEVEAAFRAVPRHAFLPDTPIEEAYADAAVVTKRDEQGTSLSSVSAPNVIAMMLELLQVRPGNRILEIGAGGYNASLLRHLTGPEGQVVSIDIDPEVVERARRGLEIAGRDGVDVLCADGEFGLPSHAPFDRIIVTAGAWDIPPAWVEQLAPGGRIVVPLRMRGLTRAVALEPEDGRLVSRAHGLCGFVDMRGAGARAERLVVLHGGDVKLWIDSELQVDADTLDAALNQPPVGLWSGVTVGATEPIHDLDLWLATVMPDLCWICAHPEAAAPNLAQIPTWGAGSPTVVEHESLAYRPAVRLVETGGQTRGELGAFAHGPDADELAARYVEQIRTWDREHRGGPGPRIEVFAAGTPDPALPEGLVIDKRHTRIAISWP